MASNQGYGYDPSQQWPATPTNPASQQWTPEVKPVAPSNTAPAYYTAAAAASAAAPLAQPQTTGWQQQSGWQKGGSLVGGYESGAQHAAAAYYVPAQGYGSGAAAQDFSPDLYPPHSSGYQVDSRQSMRYSAPRAPLTPQADTFKMQRTPQVPQAEVFKMANERLMSQMSGRGGGRGGGARGAWRGAARGSPRGGARGGRGAWRGAGIGFGSPMESGIRQKTPWPPKILTTGKPRNNASIQPSVPPMQMLEQKSLNGVVWSYQTSSGENPVYTATVNYLNNQYTGTGRSKKDSMNDAAKYLLQALGETIQNYTDEKPAATTIIPELYQLLQSKKCSIKLEFDLSENGPPFTCTCNLGGKSFNAVGSTKKLAKASVAQRLLDAINTNQIQPPVASAEDGSNSADGTKTALGQLNSRLGSTVTLDWDITSSKANSSNINMHTANLLFCGQQFSGQDASKKGAKNSVAQQILTAAENGTLELPEAPKKGQKRPASDVASETENGQPVEKQAKADPSSVNPVSRVSQMYPGLQSWTFERSGPAHQPLFAASTAIENKTFTGTAKSKKEAKAAACQAIIAAVETGLLTPPKPRTPAASKMDVDAKQTAPEPVVADPSPMDQMEETGKKPEQASDNPVSMVTKAFGTIFWETDLGGTSHEPLFVMKTTLCDRFFSGTAGSKKLAKVKACESILTAIASGELVPEKASSTVAPSGRVGQLWPGTVWSYTVDGNVHKPVFTATAVVSDVPFSGVAASKKTAKLECCRAILEALQAGTLQQPQRQSSLKFSLADIGRFNKAFGSPRIFTENVGTEAAPSYFSSTTIEEKLWSGTGSTAEESMAAVINAINVALTSGELSIPIMVKFYRRFKSPKVEVDESIGEDGIKTYTAIFKHYAKVYTATSTVSSDMAEHGVAQQALEDVIDQKREVDNSLPVTKTPMAILNEKSDRNILITIVKKPGPYPYVATATVDEQEYQGSGKSKMSARHSCAAVILAEVYGHHFDVGNFNPPQTSEDMQRGDIGSITHQALSTKVQNLVANQYSDAVFNLDSRFHGRKVLAGCVMVIGDDLDSAKVIAVAAGTKCINGGSMSHKGRVINDLHAEILVRRAVKKFLYEEIALAQDSRSNVLMSYANETGARYRLCDGVRFHLFISSPPCGDSRIFVASKGADEEPEQVRDATPNRANRGQLRVKMETGQGTIPVNAPETTKVQSWEGIMSGDRYLNMSCCDKVARWTLLGLQGSLLSTLIEPVYFSSVIVGSMFHQEHIYRGLYGRLRELETLGTISTPFRHHCPEVIGTVTPELRNTLKPPSYAIVWQAVDGSVEVLDTKTGLTYDKESSSLCKRMLFKEYRKANAGNSMPDSYEGAKSTAVLYQGLKNQLYSALEHKGLGKWVGKPAEQDIFIDSPDDPVAMVTEINGSKPISTATAASATPASEESQPATKV